MKIHYKKDIDSPDKIISGVLYIHIIDGVPSELADIIIRVFDICGRYGIDIQAAINEKMIYNSTRPFKHGGKKC